MLFIINYNFLVTFRMFISILSQSFPIYIKSTHNRLKKDLDLAPVLHLFFSLCSQAKRSSLVRIGLYSGSHQGSQQ